MCGIAGEFSSNSAMRADIDRAYPMIQTIYHRGPDEVNGWQDDEKNVALLHTRLSIVDLANGQQPMHSSQGNVTVVFNGEIYGYKRWRRLLEEGGYRFKTTSDTEILLGLYLKYGPDFVEKIEGEFAFAIYDADKKRLLMARDRFGVKPLFYSIKDGLLLFASEIKALLKHPTTVREFDREVVHRRIHGVLLPDETMFKGIKALQPGTLMLVSHTGDIVSRRHAELNPELAGSVDISRQQAEEAFEEAFEAAVQDRLHGDVDIGVYLSGGVDSNLVGVTMSKLSNASHRAFTIGFDEPPYGEAEKARVAAEQFGFTHDIEPVGANDLDNDFMRSVWHAEGNVVNTHGTAKMRLSGRASNHVKVVLAGEGADELHGGYAYFRHANLLQNLSDKDSKKALKAFLNFNGTEDGVLTLASQSRRNSLAGASSQGVPYAAQRASIFEGLLNNPINPDFKQSVQANPAGQLLDWIDQYNPKARQLDDMTLSRMTAALTDMPNYNLTFLGDRSEMANSVEGRLPFLDKRVVDLLWSLPANIHVDGNTTKTLIRSALAKQMPAETAGRYKRMFVAPSSTNAGLFKGELADRWFSTEATKSAGVFRPSFVHGLRRLYLLLPASVKFKRVLESFLMTVLSVHMMDEMFIKNFDHYLENFSMEENIQAPALKAAE